MGKKLFINDKNNSFKKTVSIDGDKSISIRTLLLGSQAYGKTSIENILPSEDIVNAINSALTANPGGVVATVQLGSSVEITAIAVA